MSERAGVSEPSDARGVVRGGVALMGAKALGVLCGFLLYVLLLPILERTLGAGAATEALGVFGTALSVLNPLNMMCAQGTLAAVSRLVASGGGSAGGPGVRVRDESAQGASADAIAWRCARVQLPGVLVLLLAYEALVPLVATRVLRDASYVPLLRWGGVIPFAYAARCVVQGFCNGTRRFAAQSLLDSGSSVARLVGVLGGAALGFGAFGALAGFAVSAMLVALVAWTVLRPARVAPAALPARAIVGFGAKTMALTGATYALMSIDLWAVKALAHPDPAVTDRLAGYLTASQKIAQIPWGILTALTWVLFPLFADARAPDARARLVRQGVRALLLLVVPVATILAATARPTYALLFPGNLRAMDAAGDTLRVVSDPLVVHALGYGALALLAVCTALLTAGGRPGVALLVVLATGLASTLGVRALTPSGSTYGAALGASLGWGAGLILAASVLRGLFGAFADVATLLRVGLAGAAVLAVGALLPWDGLAVLASDALLASVYAFVLIATRETSIGELRAVVRAATGKAR